MPGSANWKGLYREEYMALREEGYNVGTDHSEPHRAEYLPFPAEVRGELREEDIAEHQWEAAYRALWKVRENGIRADFPYVEPDDLEGIFKQASEVPALATLTANDYAHRIRGAWFGKCAAVVLGKPLEMGWSRATIKDYLVSLDAYPLNDYVPAKSEKLAMFTRGDCLPSTRGAVAFVQPDDDVHYNILGLMLAERHGRDFTKHDVGLNWIRNIPYEWCWCASRQAYYHLVNINDAEPVATQLDRIPTSLNPWRECIDGQLRGDIWGYLHPARPRSAASLAHRDCALSLTKNGVYGGMFVAGCLSGALSQSPTVDTILDAGLSVIPRRSRLAETVDRVREWHATAGAWEPVCEKIEEKYGHLPFAATMNNMAVVVLGLLHGNLDFTKTITTAVMCGFDTDCTSGTAGTIVGAAVGYNGIESRWIAPFNDTVKTVVADFGQGTISDLVERTLACYRDKFAVPQA